MLGELPPSAVFAEIRDVERRATSYATADSAGAIRLYDADLVEFASLAPGLVVDPARIIAHSLPPSLSVEGTERQVLLELVGLTEGEGFDREVILIAEDGTLVSRERGDWVRLFSWGDRVFVELNGYDGANKTLVGSGADTLYRSATDQYEDLREVMFGGRPAFYFVDFDSVRVLDLDGQLVSAYDNSPPYFPFERYGSVLSAGVLRVDVLGDGVVDYAVAVRDDADDLTSNYVAIVDATGKVLYDTIPPPDSDPQLSFWSDGGLLVLQATLPPDSLGRRYFRSLRPFDPVTLRPLATLDRDDTFYATTYGDETSIFYFAQDSAIFFDPYLGRRQAAAPQTTRIDGENYDFRGFLNLSDTVSAYGDLRYSRPPDSVSGPARHLTLTTDLEPVYSWAGGSDSSVATFTDGSVRALTRGDRTSGEWPGGQVYLLSGSDTTSAVSDVAAPHDILLAPNPTTGIVTLVSIGTNAAAPPLRVSVFGAAGQLVAVRNAVRAGESFALDVAPGLYLVEVVDGAGGRSTQRLVVR